MSEHTHESRGTGFTVGVLAGTFVGAGLALWIAPRLNAEFRQRMKDSAKAIVREAGERYQQTSARVGDAVDELTLSTREVAGVVSGPAKV